MEYFTKNQIFLLACYALTYVVVESYIFSKPRNQLKKLPLLNKLLDCWFCSGFWCSLVVSVLYFLSLSQRLSLPLLPDLILHSLAGAAFVYCADLVLSRLAEGNVSTIPIEEFDRISREASARQSMLEAVLSKESAKLEDK
jgi:hypothetical protein